MTSIMTIEDWIQQDIARQTASIDACAPDWDETAQRRFIRLLVEQGVDDLEADENEYFDFMAECAMLASENMQDARLQVLEHRVGSLENPPFNLAETLLEGVLILVGELIIVAGAYYAIPALAAAFSTRMVSREARKIVNNMPNFDEQIGRVLKLELKVLDNVQETSKLMKEIDAIGPGRWGEAVEKWEKIDDIRRNSAALRSELKIGRAAIASGKAEAAERAMNAYEQAAAKWDMNSPVLKKFVDGVYGSAILGRMGETLGQDIAAISKSSGGGGEFLAFETSGIVGELLTAIRSKRRTTRQEWGDLRIFVRHLADDEFLDNETVHGLMTLISAARYWPSKLAALTVEQRAPFVLAFESVLWRCWFAYSNLLHTVPFEERDPDGSHYEGETYEGRLVMEHYADDAPDGYGYFMNGDYYLGAASLSEPLAKLLYGKFARSFFSRRPEMVPVPMRALDEKGRFDIARYDELWKMPESNMVGMKNWERSRRLDEVRVLIIVYFMRGAKFIEAESGNDSEKKIREMILEIIGSPNPSPGQGPLDEIEDRLPNFEAPGGPAISDSTGADLRGLADALVTAGGIEQKWLMSDARSQLEIALGRLESLVIAYPLTYPTGSQAAATDEALREIEAAQDELKIRHAAFLELAEDRQDVLADADAQLGERIRELSTWSPGQSDAVAWKWYSPAAEATV